MNLIFVIVCIPIALFASIFAMRRIVECFHVANEQKRMSLVALAVALGIICTASCVAAVAYPTSFAISVLLGN